MKKYRYINQVNNVENKRYVHLSVIRIEDTPETHDLSNEDVRLKIAGLQLDNTQRQFTVSHDFFGQLSDLSFEFSHVLVEPVTGFENSIEYLFEVIKPFSFMFYFYDSNVETVDQLVTRFKDLYDFTKPVSYYGINAQTI